MGEEGEGESVRVAVRVRMFNDREAGKSKKCIRMRQEAQGSRTWVVQEDGTEKEFKFDFSYQSCDQEDTAMGEWANQVPQRGAMGLIVFICAQETVFNTLGRPVVTDALSGRNICLFAYGQTGAGKSFSMLGKLPGEPGIIPRACEAHPLPVPRSDQYLLWRAPLCCGGIRC